MKSRILVVFGALWLIALIPIWWPRFLPLLDIPHHLTAIAIWHRLDDPSWGYSRFYTLNLLPVPYWTYFASVHLLAYVLPLEIANKVMMSLYALLLPVGAAQLGYRMGRSPWLGLFAFPFVFNSNFSFGFVTFCLGMVMFLFGVIALDRFMREPSARRAFALAAMAILGYLTHLFTWVVFGVAALGLLWCYGLRIKRMAVAAAAMLPSVALAIYGFAAAQTGSTEVQRGPLHWHARYASLGGSLREFSHYTLTNWHGGPVRTILIVLACAWFALFVSGLRQRNREEPLLFRYRLEWVVLVSAGAALLLPVHLYSPIDVWLIGFRFFSLTAMLIALLPYGPMTRVRALCLVPVVAVAVAYPIGLGNHWRRFSDRAESVPRLMRNVPRGSSTLTLLVGDRGDVDADPLAVAYNDFASYPQFFSGGFDPYVLQTGFPVVTRRDRALPAPPWSAHQQFSFDLHGRYYDYLMIHREPAVYSLLPGREQQAPLIAEDGDWKLYRVIH